MKHEIEKTAAGDWYPANRDELQELVEDEDVYLGDIDTSRITDMSDLFQYSERRNFKGIETWDVSNVKNMAGMFFLCHKFNQPIGKWDVSKVENMAFMFSGAKSFNQPIGNWDVSKVKDMHGIFMGANPSIRTSAGGMWRR